MRTPAANDDHLTYCSLCDQVTTAAHPTCLDCQQQLAESGAAIEREAERALKLDTGLLELDELKVPRLGERLVEQGMLDAGMLRFALRVQAHRAEKGDQIRLGQLLLELGLVSRQTLEQASLQQLLQTQQALQQSNRQLEQRVQESTHGLKNALVKLGELSQLKADFVANLSHELRTPLAIMNGIAELLGNESLGALNAEQAKAMAALTGAGDRLGKLVDDLLNFSEATQGAIKLQLESIYLPKPVDQAMGRVTDLAREREVMLERNLPEALPLVRADRQKVSWVIGEFLENAVKYTQPGGLVSLQAEAQPDCVQVEVTDSGTGIPPHKLEEAFFPFHQLDGAIDRQQGGTGLGLALAKRIIEAHGSRIDVHSQVGQGSSFAFSLPIAK